MTTNEWMHTRIHHGLTPVDWSVLFRWVGKPEFGLRQLQTWIGTGYITEAQADAIASEMEGQLITTLFSWTFEGMKKHFVNVEARKAEREAAEEEKRLAYAGRHGMLFERPPAKPPKLPPFTEYGPVLEELRSGFIGEIPQTETWRDWFRSKYGRLIEQFKAKPEEERTEKGWREHLKTIRPEIREQWWRLSPYQRGERPGVFAPRIQTTRF